MPDNRRSRLHSRAQTSQSIDEQWSSFNNLHCIYLDSRDIKPANIFLTAGTSIKIGDFGLGAEILGSERTATTTGVVYGMHLYMTPEIVHTYTAPNRLRCALRFPLFQRQKREAIRYNEQIDMYALGIIVLELLAPFKTVYGRSKVIIGLEYMKIRFLLRFESGFESARRRVKISI